MNLQTMVLEGDKTMQRSGTNNLLPLILTLISFHLVTPLIGCTSSGSTTPNADPGNGVNPSPPSNGTCDPTKDGWIADPNLYTTCCATSGPSGCPPITPVECHDTTGSCHKSNTVVCSTFRPDGCYCLDKADDCK